MKKAIDGMLVVVMMLCFLGCGNDTSKSLAQIYHDNGQIGNAYSNYNMENFKQETSDSKISGSYSDFVGMVMLWTYEVDEDIALDVNYSIKVTEGRVKLVMVNPAGEVYTIAEFTNGNALDKIQTQTFSLHDGMYRLKLVGIENADVDFLIEVKGGDFIGTK